MDDLPLPVALDQYAAFVVRTMIDAAFRLDAAEHEGVTDDSGIAVELKTGFEQIYSKTWMFFLAQMSLRACGQTLTVTSPRWAVRSRYMKVRDCPMPPPMLNGMRSLRSA